MYFTMKFGKNRMIRLLLGCQVLRGARGFGLGFSPQCLLLFRKGCNGKAWKVDSHLFLSDAILLIFMIWRVRSLNHRLCTVLLIVGLTGFCWVKGFHNFAWASPGTDVFQSFTRHVGAQIGKDKQEFSIADTCTAWFYQHMGQKPPRPEVEKIHFIPLGQTVPDLDCAKLFPDGLEQARKAFGHAQQLLSLSLTFFQMALVGDGDDNQEYSSDEIHDVLESFGLPFHEGQPLGRYIGDLTGLFDTIWREVQFQFLMEGMQVLMKKGYRFTGADQTALNQELQ
jgi:hypothetical protein